MNRDWSCPSLHTYFRDIVQYCSGTLLSDRVVLTAAHCLYRQGFGLADHVRVTNEGWSFYAPEYTIRRDFIVLPVEKNACADMALIFLPRSVPHAIPPTRIKFAKFHSHEFLEQRNNAEIFALGYGITEHNRVSLLPRKVPMQFVTAESECTLNFLFSHSAISCSGDSGGPVLYYPKNTTGLSKQPFSRQPVYVGISTQIAIYIDEKSSSLLRKSQFATSKQDMDDCKRAKELSVLHTYYVQKWLLALLQTEKDANRWNLYMEALVSLIGE